MKNDLAKKILQETEAGYDLIAHKFSQTRKRFWGGLEFIAGYVQEHDRVLDFGCGNGRLLELIGKVPDLEYYGADVSEKLLEFAREKYPAENRRFSKLDPIRTSIPFDDEFFNAVYSIAVFHHIPSAGKRRELARELFRTTSCGGYVVVTVWNLWQRKYAGNVLVNWKNKLLGRSSLDWRDCYISFTDNAGVKFQRFHHAFTKKELRQLFEDAGFRTLRCEVVDGRNLVFVGKK